MSQAEHLTSDQSAAFLQQIVLDGLCGTFSSLHGGKWNIVDIVILAADQTGIRVQTLSENTQGLIFKKDQPVGLCFPHEHYNYIFESAITEPPTPASPTELKFDMPDKIERMQRRAYERQPIPNGLNVRAMFWHRGHMKHPGQKPREDYWQGKLENLSAGGTMIRVKHDYRDFFSMDQLVGVQFTPMSYQKPLLLEARVRHLDTPPAEESLLVGVEFIGLEASPEGRDTLHRLLEVVDAYEKMNKKAALLT
jgi:c-di-GMP-binding flagellar brake protein YcgR